MSAGASAFDPLQYLEAFPALKYAFALGVMIITLLGIAKSARRVAAGQQQPQQPAPSAYDSGSARLERKVDRLTFHLLEARREIHDLLDIVRPGARRRHPTELEPIQPEDT